MPDIKQRELQPPREKSTVTQFLSDFTGLPFFELQPESWAAAATIEGAPAAQAYRGLFVFFILTPG